MIKKHITLTDGCLEILDEMLHTEPDISNYSEAIRAALISYNSDKQESEINNLKFKVNEMSKDLSMLLAMVAGGFHECKVYTIPPKDDCSIYKIANGYVSDEIQRHVTAKSSLRNNL